jgi:hypothetical protein
MTHPASTTSSDASIQIELAPEPQLWKRALQTHTPSPARAQLGIPNDRSIVLSGHQPIVFHPGILAKLIAQFEIAQTAGAGRVWIVPDQDVVDLETVRIPVGEDTDLKTQHVRILPEGSIPPDVPTASLPPIEPVEPLDKRLLPLYEYLQGYTYEETLAKQFANATIQLACDRLGMDPPQIIYASKMLQSEAIWDEVYHRAHHNPEETIVSYNAAAAQYPEARVRSLYIDTQRENYEYPFWRLRDGHSRIASNDTNFNQLNLAPRGLLMSGLARQHLGELFIHGTGGWIYDKVTEDWFKNWQNIELSPMCMATASVRLPLGFDTDNAPSLPQAHWRHHHARHHPALVGDHDSQHKRDALVRQINDARASRTDPGAIYRQLVKLLENHRVRNAIQLQSLKEQIDNAHFCARQIELANDRTWAFVLHHDDVLLDLQERIRLALS